MQRNFIRIKFFVAVSVVLLVLLVVIFGIFEMDGYRMVQARVTTEEAIRRGVINCYAIEGIYPPSLEYLEKNYGVFIDYKLFDVSYVVRAHNVMPYVKVMTAGKWSISV